MNKHFAIIFSFLGGFVSGINLSILEPAGNYAASWSNVYIAIGLVVCCLLLVKGKP